MVAHTVWPAVSAGSAPVKIPSPPPKLSWCAVMAPSDLRYTGTSVQTVHHALTKAFIHSKSITPERQWPIKLTTEDLPILKGMAAVALDGSEPYDILYAALERFGEIEIRNQ